MRIAFVIAAGVAIGVAAWCGVAGASGSNPLAPASMLIVVPSLLVAEPLGSVRIALFMFSAILALSYLAFSSQLLRGVPSIPTRSWVLLALLVVGSAGWFSVNWSYGVEYQGFRFTVASALLNAAMGAAVAMLGWANSRRANWSFSYTFHTLLFLWLGWLSFPWLGEML